MYTIRVGGSKQISLAKIFQSLREMLVFLYNFCIYLFPSMTVLVAQVDDKQSPNLLDMLTPAASVWIESNTGNADFQQPPL